MTGRELITRRDDKGNIINHGVIELDTYRNLIKSGSLTKHGRGGNGRDIYIEYDSIRPDIKALIREKYGDPKKQADIKPFKDQIVQDPNARTFFNNHLKPDGKTLTDKQKLIYSNDADILNAIKTIYDKYCARRLAVGASIKKFWHKALDAVNDYRESYEKLYKIEYPCSLPTSVRRLKIKYNDYCTYGYITLVDGRNCNSNSEKICDEGKEWILAQWSNRINVVTGMSHMLELYNKEAQAHGWKPVEKIDTIHNFLYRPDIQNKWYGYRYGELKAKEKFSFQHSTILPTMRDSLWYSDGTKLNYFYQDENGKVCTCQVYEVMDVYSEVLLGYHISPTEDFIAQYHAYKMALKTSGYRPYEIRYDNQGGHNKLKNGDFLKKLAHLSINTAPYNGKSKTIESAFNRFQHEFLKREWYFTGQNITTKKLESKANYEFMLANKHNLPTLDEIKKIYEQRRSEWNKATHPKTDKARLEMYHESHNPKAIKVEMWDLVELFWITRKKEVTCYADGISFTEKGEDYKYMVYTSEDKPDIAWLRSNIDKKFTVKFDVDDTSLIHLYEQTHDGLRFVTAAETKLTVHRGKQEQEEWEAEYFRYVETENKRLRIDTRDKMDAILETYNLLPEQNGLNSPGLKGIENKKKKQAKKTEIASVQKAISNAVILNDDDFDENELYKLY